MFFECLEDKTQENKFIQTTDTKNGIYFVKEPNKVEKELTFGDSKFVKYKDGFEKTTDDVAADVQRKKRDEKEKERREKKRERKREEREKEKRGGERREREEKRVREREREESEREEKRERERERE